MLAPAATGQSIPTKPLINAGWTNRQTSAAPTVVPAPVRDVAPVKPLTGTLPAAPARERTAGTGMPPIFVRSNYFLTDGLAGWLRDRGMSLEVSEFYVQSNPGSSGPGSDLQKYREGAALTGDALEQHKRNFPGWDLANFPLKAAEQGTAWRRDPSRFFHKDLGLRDHSSWNELGSKPAEFDGFILNDYEGWIVDFTQPEAPGALSPGNRRMLASMMQAHDTLRARYPKAKLALYGFPNTFASGLHGSVGMIRSMMNDPQNPILYGNPSTAVPNGRLGGGHWQLSAERLRNFDLATAGTPELVRFAARSIDVLTPTCYPRAVPNGPATWGNLEHAGGLTGQAVAKAQELGARVLPFANTDEFRRWSSSLYRGVAGQINGVDSIFYIDPKRPDLGAHTTNYWQTFRSVELSREVARKVREQHGRILPVYPVISWHNSLSNDDANPVPPLSPAEFEEGIVLPAKQAGADGVYVWDRYLFPMQVLAAHYDKDQIPGHSVATMRKTLRQLIVKSGVRIDPSIPAGDSVSADPRWKEPAVLRAFIRNIEDAKRRYYEPIAKHFGVEPASAPVPTSKVMPSRTGVQRTVSGPR
jgi:hypothetical protein